MRLLTLFLALLIAILPDGAPQISCPLGQDVYAEEIVDVEEEAVLRYGPRMQKTAPGGPLIPFLGIRIVESVYYSNIRSFCPSFARQWLACRSLRL